MSSIVKKSLSRLPNMLLPALIMLLGAASSCNSKSDPVSDEPAVTISTVAVKSFNLKADTKILDDLDSVFFSIDLNRGIIFNADSLPKGTNIAKLIPVITFQSSMLEANIVMEGGSEKNDTVNYLTNSTDTIDFSRKVTLKVTALDGTSKYSYHIKVNVHKQEPDSLMWDKLAVAKLPSRLTAPLAQKSVQMGDKIYSLIRENDNTMTMSMCDDLFKDSWDKTNIELPFEADIRSLEATSDALWILAADGNLHTSTDGIIWTATGEKWVSIIGTYLDSVLGIKDSDSGLMHCHYPASAFITDSTVDPDFPLYGRSVFSTISSKWTPNPSGIFIGGVTPSGELTSDVWAFDGSNWAVISENVLPPLEGASLIRYIMHRQLKSSIKEKDQEVWLAFGGKTADGNFNRTVYISYDNGVNWKKGTSLLQFPDYFPSLSFADGIVMTSPLEGDLSDAWSTRASKETGRWLTRAYTLDGYDITWDCPFIYIIGGDDADGQLSDTIWRGVIARLMFTPII